MRIALINSEHPSRGGNGGIATYTYTLANALAAAGNTVHVFVRHGVCPETLDGNVKIHPFGHAAAPMLLRIVERAFDKGPLRWEKGCARSCKNELLALHRQEGLDAAELPEYGGLAWALGDIEAFPVVVNFHTPSEMVDQLNKTPLTRDRKRWYRYEGKAFRKASAFRSPSNALKNRICSWYGIPPAAVTVIRNPLSTRPYDQLKKKFAAAPDRIDILFAGRLEYRKGIAIIAEYIRDILRMDPRICLTFAGESVIGNAPDYRMRIENSLDDDERRRVFFPGPVKRSDLAVLYCRSSMLLMPSLFENAPFALLEAMAARLPVIAADTGGVAEIIEHGKNGLLFPIDAPKELIARIGEYIRNPTLSRSCADQAYRDLQARHAPEKIAAESIAFYQSLLLAKPL